MIWLLTENTSLSLLSGSIMICSRKDDWTVDKTLFETTFSMYQNVSPQSCRRSYSSVRILTSVSDFVAFYSPSVQFQMQWVVVTKQSMNHGSKALVQEEMTQSFWLKDGGRHFLPLLLLMCSCAAAGLTYTYSLLAH